MFYYAVDYIENIVENNASFPDPSLELNVTIVFHERLTWIYEPLVS